jgi:hypothetical protein
MEISIFNLLIINKILMRQNYKIIKFLMNFKLNFIKLINLVIQSKI